MSSVLLRDIESAVQKSFHESSLGGPEFNMAHGASVVLVACVQYYSAMFFEGDQTERYEIVKRHLKAQGSVVPDELLVNLVDRVDELLTNVQDTPLPLSPPIELLRTKPIAEPEFALVCRRDTCVLCERPLGGNITEKAYANEFRRAEVAKDPADDSSNQEMQGGTREGMFGVMMQTMHF